MGVCNKKLIDPVVFLGGGGLFATATTLLRPVFAQRLALDVATVRERDHHVGGRDQVFGAQVVRAVLHQTAACSQLALAELGFDDRELFANDDGDAFRLGQNVQQVFNLGHHLFVLCNDLVLFQPGQALQTHLQNFLGLRVGQAVQAVTTHAEHFFQTIRTVVVGVNRSAVGTGAGQHLAHQLAVPRLVHQLHLGHRWRRGVANDGDEVVDVGQGNRQAFQHMAALARLAQVEHRAARHHFAAVLQEDFNQVFQVAQLGLAVDQRHHVHAKRVLQLRLFVQVVQHHFGYFAPLQFNHQTHAGLVRLVLDVADAFDFLLMHQLGHAFLQGLFVHLVGQLVHDDGLALALVDVLKMAFGTHHHLATSGTVAVFDAIDAVNNAGGGEVRGRDDLHQFVNCGFRVPQQVHARINHFVQVVWRNVGGHADGNTA